MSYSDLIFTQLNTLPYFTKTSVLQVAEKFELPISTVNTLISRAIKRREIIQLKRNYYVTQKFFEENTHEVSYHFFLANKLLSPSYISLESALQYYGMLTESIGTINTSVTKKYTQTFNSREEVFKYNVIAPKLFKDYVTISAKFEFRIATRSKAVFDFLYFRTREFRSEFAEDILEDLRIDTDELTYEDTEYLKTEIRNFTYKHMSI